MDLIDRDALLLKQKAHADLFADSTAHDDIVRRDEATAALAEIINAPAVNRWIAVEDALPEKDKSYITYAETTKYCNHNELPEESRIMFIDYAPCESCNNPDTFGMICVKCGECGREFNDAGVCTNIDDYPADDDYEE